MVSEDKTRSAGVRQEDRLLGKTSAEIVAAAKASREIDSTWRVYRYAPVVIGRFHERDSAQVLFERRYEGRVRDWSIEAPSKTSMKHTLLVNLWTVDSEWKTSELALQRVAELPEGETLEVVPRNSRAEHVLAQFGILKLPS